MTAITTTADMTAPDTTVHPHSANPATCTPSLWRAGAVSGVVAAVAATAAAAVALGAGVPMEIQGEQIPLLGFAQLTLMATVVGVLLAKALVRWAAMPQRTFVVSTVVLTVLSFVPDLTIDATVATRLVLMATHLVAAPIIIPVLAKRLPVARTR